MIIDTGQNNSRYGAVVFYKPEKGRRKIKRKIIGEGKYIFVEKKEKEETIFCGGIMGTYIMDTCIMYKCIIMDTCVTSWIHESWIHASWIHVSWIHASWTHASWIHAS